MKMRIGFILFIFFVLVFSGCAGKIVTEWDKPGATEEEFKQDLAQCVYEAKSNNQQGMLSEKEEEKRFRELRDLCLKAKGYTIISKKTMRADEQ